MKEVKLTFAWTMCVIACACLCWHIVVDRPRALAAYQQEGGKTSLGTYRVSAYCLCDECINVPAFRDGLTASGKPAVGKIIAGPPSMPFGTRLMVPGYGVASCEDRGGAIKGKRLDVLFPSHQAALNWGVQHLDIEQLN